jgi:hypothetical protein
MLVRSALPLLLLALVAPTCAVYANPACTVGADCASGVCDGDGTCGAPSSGGTGGASATTSTGAGAGGAATCSPDHDGIITRAEVPLAPGLHANFLAAEDAGVNTAGTTGADGGVTWDLSVTFSGDHSEAVDTLALGPQWFGADFPGASYTAVLSDTSDLLGVFTLSETALTLVGVASPTAGSTQTELHYSPAVTVLAFPMALNATWTTTSTVTGTAEGVDVIYSETYQSTVDAAGALKTPYATFDVLRVDTLLTRVVGALITTTRTFSFVTECFGNVATIVSNTDDTLTVDFTTAAEVSRLAP